MKRAAETSSKSRANGIRAQVLNLVPRGLNGLDAARLTDFDWPGASAPSARTKAILIYLREASLSCATGSGLNYPADEGLARADYDNAVMFITAYTDNRC